MRRTACSAAPRAEQAGGYTILIGPGFVNKSAPAAAIPGEALEMPEVAVQTLEIARDHFPNDTEVLKQLGRADAPELEARLSEI